MLVTADAQPETQVSELLKRTRPSWLTPQALQVAGAISHLDPAEGVGIMAWLIKQLGSGRLEASGRRVVAHWLQQLSRLASQTAVQMLSPDS